jgi:tetratricopeptide (TPR) repeat protein
MTRTILAGMALIAMSAACLIGQGKKVSKGEADAYNAMVHAAQSGDNDATIKAADELITKFSDTQFKGVALLLEARAYEGKGDDDHAQVYAEQAMAVDPKGYQAPLLIGAGIVTHTRENDLDKDEKLAKAEKDLNLAIENAKAAEKPNPQLTDAQWEEGKKFTIAEAQADLGRVFMLRKKYADAIAPLQAAADTDPQPAYFVWLASSQQQAGKNDDAIATVDKLLAQPNLDPRFRQAATAVKLDAAKAKGGK